MNITTTAQGNPFASHRIDDLGYRFVDEDWASALSRLAALEYRAAIIGPEGKGKTTLLFELERQLRERGNLVRLERLAPQGLETERSVVAALPGSPKPRTDCEFVDPRHCASDISGEEILLIDSAGLLTQPERLRLRFLARKARGLVITSHEPSWLPTWVTCTTTLESSFSSWWKSWSDTRSPASGSISIRSSRRHDGKRTFGVSGALRPVRRADDRRPLRRL